MPSLTGVSSVTVYHGKKNVFDITTYPITKKRYIRASDGYFAISTIDLRGATEDYIPCVSMRGKTWVINKPNQSSNTMGLAFYDENKAFLSSVLTYPSGTNGVFTVPNDASYFRFTVDLSSADDTEIQIEAGTTATAFSLFFAPVSVTVSLGRTIYGGSVDVLHGTGTDGWCEPLTFTGAESENWTWGQNGGFYRANITVYGIAYTVGARSECFCNLGTYKSSGNDYNACFIYGNPTSAQFFFYPPQGVESLADFKTWLSNNNLKMTAQKATPEDFTFTPTPINSFWGDNNIWCDSVDSEVTYRADIALALAALQGNRSLGLMTARPDPEEPEEDPEEPEER